MRFRCSGMHFRLFGKRIFSFCKESTKKMWVQVVFDISEHKQPLCEHTQPLCEVGWDGGVGYVLHLTWYAFDFRLGGFDMYMSSLAI